MSVRIRKVWPNREDDKDVRPVEIWVEHVGLDVRVTDFPATGRLIFHFEEGSLKRIESFDEGPSRRDAKNSKPKE